MVDDITSDADLRRAAEQAGMLLQMIHNYCTEKDRTHSDIPDARVRFPRGFIRPAAAQRARIQFIQGEILRDNIAYTLILSDTVLWLALRTDLWGVPKQMLVKLHVFLIGALCESITRDYLHGICGKNFARRAQFLLDKEVINEKTHEDLVWLWDVRNRMHLWDLDGTEYNYAYDQDCHRRANRALRTLLSNLATRGRLHGDTG